MTNLSFVKHRISLHLAGSEDLAGANDVGVLWTEVANGVTDVVTGALVGVETPLSGVLRGFGYEVEATTVVRRFQEIQAGDLLLDVLPDAPVTLYLGQPQSGVVSLDSLAGKGVRLVYGDRLYTQKDAGEDLAQAWDAIVGNQKLSRTLLLRRAT